MSTEEDGSPALTFHVSLTVSDLERSINFYVEHLGFRPPLERYVSDRPWFGEGIGIPGAVADQGHIRRGKFLLELWQYRYPASQKVVVPDTSHVGAIHFGFEVDDIDESYERMKAAGVEFLSPPVTVDITEYAGSRWCYFRDPDGYLLEISQQPPGVSLDNL